MTPVTYAIVFGGDIVEGFQAISVKAHMAKLLKADAVKMQILFSGKPIVMKRTADKAAVTKYGSALKKIGADVKDRIIKPTEPAPASPAPGRAHVAQAPNAKAPKAIAPEVAAQPKTPQKRMPQDAETPAANKSALPAKLIEAVNFSLKDNKGNLFKAAPDVPTPALDLSQLALAENDGSPIIEPGERAERLDLDLSALSVAENDDTPLAAPEPEVEKIQAPDFGLDEPGAILATIKEQVEFANPDTSGMSLAFSWYRFTQ